MLIAFVGSRKHKHVHRGLSITQDHDTEIATFARDRAYALDNASNRLLFPTVSDILKRNGKIASFHAIRIKHVARQAEAKRISLERIELAIIPSFGLFPVHNTFIFTVLISKETRLAKGRRDGLPGLNGIFNITEKLATILIQRIKRAALD